MGAEANPLVARVVVNRLWAELFGRGLVATPNEGLVALDAALKAADVRIVSLTMPPSETNYMGVMLTGDQPACKAAAMAFQNKVLEVAANPLNY